MCLLEISSEHNKTGTFTAITSFSPEGLQCQTHFRFGLLVMSLFYSKFIIYHHNSSVFCLCDFYSWIDFQDPSVTDDSNAPSWLNDGSNSTPDQPTPQAPISQQSTQDFDNRPPPPPRNVDSAPPSSNTWMEEESGGGGQQNSWISEGDQPQGGPQAPEGVSSNQSTAIDIDPFRLIDHFLVFLHFLFLMLIES